MTLDEFAKENCIKTTYIFDREGGTPYGGATIGWRYTSDRKNSKVVEVSVIYCSTKDVFSKKEGRELMLRAFQRGNTCLLYTSPSPRDTERSRMPSSA